MFMRYIH